MADLLPQNFPPISPAAIASYDFTDVSAGTGIQAYYASVFASGSSSAPPATTSRGYLTSSQHYSSKVATSGAILAGAATGYILQDTYDLTFNLPQRIKGKAYLNISIGGTRAGAVGSSPNLWVSGAFIENQTTGEVLGTIQNSENLEFTPAAKTTFSKTMLMEFDMSDKVYLFNKGDVLRLNINLWGTGGSSSGIKYGGYGVDPKDRDDPTLVAGASGTISGAVTTQTILYLPFQIDIG